MIFLASCSELLAIISYVFFVVRKHLGPMSHCSVAIVAGLHGLSCCTAIKVIFLIRKDGVCAAIIKNGRLPVNQLFRLIRNPVLTSLRIWNNSSSELLLKEWSFLLCGLAVSEINFCSWVLWNRALWRYLRRNLWRIFRRLSWRGVRVRGRGWLRILTAFLFLRYRIHLTQILRDVNLVRNSSFLFACLLLVLHLKCTDLEVGFFCFEYSFISFGHFDGLFSLEIPCYSFVDGIWYDEH